MVYYDDYEDDPWSEDYDEYYHEEDYELSEEELEELRQKEEFAGLSDDEIYKKLLEKENSDEEYEYDEIVGGRDKKPIMSTLNKKKLSKFEMDELMNKLDEF